jgi:hypothetical protein
LLGGGPGKSGANYHFSSAASSLEGYTANLLSRKMELIAVVGAVEVSDASISAELEAGLCDLAPVLLPRSRGPSPIIRRAASQTAKSDTNRW